MEPLFDTNFRNKVQLHAQCQPDALPAMLSVLQGIAENYEKNGLINYSRDALNCVSYIKESIKSKKLERKRFEEALK